MQLNKAWEKERCGMKRRVIATVLVETMMIDGRGIQCDSR